MNKEEKLNKLIDFLTQKSSASKDKIDTVKEVLETLNDHNLNKLVAGIVFADKPFKSKKKIWRIE
jgi:ribosomal protein L18E|tara:strand:+ start:826 stop:1020 length:195 start_codon:yes stop_codon:yes gene_type:complete